MSRDSRPSKHPAGRAASKTRQRLFEELGAEVRANQRATDVVDELVCQLLRINRTDARCLDILDQRGAMTAGELARESRLTTGAITAVIDRLEDAGLARRVRDPADRRRVRIVPTPDADRLSMELMVQPLTELSRPVMGRYDDDELRLLIDFHRTARDIQERHADWLRARLEQRER